MNDMVLIEFLEKAKRLNKAVQLEGEGGIDMERIEPGDEYFFKEGCLLLKDRIFDCKYIAFAKLIKNAAERDIELRESLRRMWGPDEEV